MKRSNTSARYLDTIESVEGANRLFRQTDQDEGTTTLNKETTFSNTSLLNKDNVRHGIVGSQLYKIPSAAESPDIKTSSRENILQMSESLISPPLVSTWTRNKFADKPVDKVMKR